MGLRLRGSLTEVRRATEDDVELLVAWHADPDVSRYWDGETFKAEGRPVGYLQAWREGDAGGLDMFLIPEARGRGLGPDAARALATSLRDEGWTRITVDPYLWNERAIEAWKRAGFEPVERRSADDEHTAEWLLMELA